MTPITSTTAACIRGGIESVTFDSPDLAVAFVKVLAGMAHPAYFMTVLENLMGVVSQEQIVGSLQLFKACLGAVPA